jgi:hypothetical protein
MANPFPARWAACFLPFDAAIGRKFADDLVMSLEASVPIIRDYPVYSFKTEFKIAVNF